MPLRIEFPGAFYHVMNRANTGMNIFRSEWDREKFLEYIGEAVKRYGIKVHTFCLHYHFLIETPPEPGDQMDQRRLLRVFQSKGKKSNLARDVAIYLCRELTGETSAALGRRFGICGAGVAAWHGRIAKNLETDRKLKGRED